MAKQKLKQTKKAFQIWHPGHEQHGHKLLPMENEKLSNFHCHNHQKSHRYPWQRRARIRSHRLYYEGYLAKMSAFQETLGWGNAEKVPETANQMTRLSPSSRKRKGILYFCFVSLLWKYSSIHSFICSSFYKNERSTLALSLLCMQIS